ncbi:MAG: MurR/RpiR family transcriptional regulator [Rhodospirillales bacterium]
MKNAPASFSNLTSEITAEYAGLSRQLQKFGRYALDHADVVALETVTTIAELADVQPSTIVRFAKAFGYDGFSDLQKVFRTRLMENTSSYRERIHSLENDDRSGTASVLHAFADAGIESLEQLKQHAHPERMQQAIDIIRNAGDIHLLAQGRSYAVAHYLHYALSRLEIRSLLIDGAGGMMRHQVARVRPDDAVIAISFSPYTPVVAELVGHLADQGRKVISITDSPLSPLASRSAVSFEINDGSEQAFRSLIAPICLAQSLVVGVGQALEQTRN